MVQLLFVDRFSLTVGKNKLLRINNLYIGRERQEQRKGTNKKDDLNEPEPLSISRGEVVIE